MNICKAYLASSGNGRLAAAGWFFLLGFNMLRSCLGSSWARSECLTAFSSHYQGDGRPHLQHHHKYPSGTKSAKAKHVIIHRHAPTISGFGFLPRPSQSYRRTSMPLAPSAAHRLRHLQRLCLIECYVHVHDQHKPQAEPTRPIPNPAGTHESYIASLEL